MPNRKLMKAINKLIRINNDRIEGYKTAIRETEEESFKTLFSKFRETSEKCRKELATVILQFGGIPDEGTKLTGKFFRLWMDAKAAFTGRANLAILDSCEIVENAAINNYQRVLFNHTSELTQTQRRLISEQSRLITADLDHVRVLRQALKNITVKKVVVN